MTETRIGLLVGAHFRPPAKTVLRYLPQGAALLLEPEPENPYDEHAIRVLVQPQEIPSSQHEALGGELLGNGWTLEQLLAEQLLHLGYLAAERNKDLLTHPGCVPNTVIASMLLNERHEARLVFAGDGYPMVEVKMPSDDAAEFYEEQRERLNHERG